MASSSQHTAPPPTYCSVATDGNMEPLMSASLGAMGSLLRKLDDLAAINGAASGLRGDFGSLSKKLEKLSQADEPSRTMNYWMKDVRELSYDMEDCIDQFIYSADPDAWISNLLGFRSRMQEASERYDRYNLEYGLTHSVATVRHCFRTVFTDLTPVVPEPMDQLRRQIELRIDDDNDHHLKVLSILGVEGVGKSTIAQNLWEKLGGNFECKAFVQTAKRLDMRTILRSILSQICLQQMPEQACEEVPNLTHEIRKQLQEKRYFIIIEDLWAVSVWDVLSRSFPEGDQCSRILTTTSINDVALACCSNDYKSIFDLKPLSFYHSYGLFINRVFGPEKECPQQFSDVSEDITRKCGGLPLAIVCIATLVTRHPETIEHWEFVQSFLHCSLRPSSSCTEILKQVLELCYNTLPHCLKTCLLYLSTYPENYIFLKDDLVMQWIAAEFICPMEGTDIVQVARNYFNVLLCLGLIQPMDFNCKKKGLSYVLHPTVFEFIVLKSMEDNFITIIDYSQSTVALTDKIHWLALHFGSVPYAAIPESIILSQLRSFAFMGLLGCMPSFTKFKLVRIMILHLQGHDRDTTFNLQGIREMLLLRYLQVRCNVTLELPDQIQHLKYLETLEINARVAKVPSDIIHVKKMLNLSLGQRKNHKHLTLGNVASGKPASLNDSSSESTPRFHIFELLPPICVFSRVPMWIRKFRRLCTLEVVVRELSTEDISAPGELPALTALSLYVRTPSAEIIVLRKGAFPALEYFKFVSGVLLLEFQEEATPNLRTLKLCFNAHKGERYGDMLTGVRYVLNLQKVVASIGAANDAEECDRRAARSAIEDAITKYPFHGSFKLERAERVWVKIKRVDRVDEESINKRDQAPEEPEGAPLTRVQATVMLPLSPPLSDPTSEGHTAEDPVPEEPHVTKLIKDGHTMVYSDSYHTSKKMGRRITPSLRPKLAFRKPLQLPIFTGNNILDAYGNPLQVSIVDDALPFFRFSRMEIFPLLGDFPPDNRDDWSADEFDECIVHQRKMLPLLIGDVKYYLHEHESFATFNEVQFTDNSSWIPCGKFRIGVRAWGSDGSMFLEAMTEAFVVGDRRGEPYQKHYPPLLGDDVWRLEKIDKEGTFHKSLRSSNVHTVQEFLRMLMVKPDKLRAILGKGMTNRMWQAMTRHAMTCFHGDKVYAYSTEDHGTIYVNSILDLLKVKIRGMKSNRLEMLHRMFLDHLLWGAYDHRHSLQEVDAGMLQGYDDANYILWKRPYGFPSQNKEPVVVQAELDSQPDEGSGSTSQLA